MDEPERSSHPKKFPPVQLLGSKRERYYQGAIVNPFAETTGHNLLEDSFRMPCYGDNPNVTIKGHSVAFSWQACLPVFSRGNKSAIWVHSASVNSYRLNIMNTSLSLFYYERGGIPVLYTILFLNAF